MRCNNRYGATSRLKLFFEPISHAFTVVAVGIGDGHGFHAFFDQNLGHNFGLPCIRRSRAKEHTIVFGHSEFGSNRHLWGSLLRLVP
jgi:hypothetical protein